MKDITEERCFMMIEKRFDLELDMNITDNVLDKEYDLHTDEAFEFLEEINKLSRNLNYSQRMHERYKKDALALAEENKELKQLIDLFAQDICNLTEILSKNQLDYKLHSDVENFIIKWGVRIE